MIRALHAGIVLFLATYAGAAEPDPESLRREALARYGLGLWKARTDLPSQAIKQYEAAAKADPTAAEPLRPLVKLYAEMGRDAAAIRTARAVLDRDPDDAETAQTLGKLLYDGRKFAESAKVLNQAAASPRLNANPAHRLGILLDSARASEAAADGAGAEAALGSATAILTDRRDELLKTRHYPTAADVARELASVREKLGRVRTTRTDYAGAVTAFREAHKIAADKAGANDPITAARLDWNLSGVLLAQGKTEDALIHLERFLALNPSAIEPYERYADLMRRQGQGPLAITALKRMAETNPQNKNIRWVLAAETGKTDPTEAGRLFRELARTTTAPEFFQRFVQFEKGTGRIAPLLNTADETYKAARGGRNPDDEETPEKPAAPAPAMAVARARALTAAIKAEPDLAEALVRQAAADLRAKVERHGDTLELIAYLAERIGKSDVAELALTTAVRAGSASAFSGLYQLLYRQRKWTELLLAIDEFEVAEKRVGRDPTTYYDSNRAVPLAELGRDREARAVAEKVIANAKSRLGGRLVKVQVLNVLGKHAEAVAECRDTFGDAHTPAEVYRVRVALSNSYLGMRKYAEAEAELRSVLDDDPDDVLVLNNLGYNLADQGRRLDEAEAMIRRAIELDADARLKAGSPETDSGTYIDSLGWVLFRKGKLAEARTALETAAKSADAATDATVWDHLGDVCFRLGDRTKAREAWTKAAAYYQGSHAGKQFGRRDEVVRKLALVP